MEHEEKTTSPIVATREGFTLHENHELWTVGEYAFRCGTVTSPDHLDEAIGAHQEEMESLLADAREEFGF
jgi:hypothetical protein